MDTYKKDSTQPMLTGTMQYVSSMNGTSMILISLNSFKTSNLQFVHLILTELNVASLQILANFAVLLSFHC